MSQICTYTQAIICTKSTKKKHKYKQTHTREREREWTSRHKPNLTSYDVLARHQSSILGGSSHKSKVGGISLCYIMLYHIMLYSYIPVLFRISKVNPHLPLWVPNLLPRDPRGLQALFQLLDDPPLGRNADFLARKQHGGTAKSVMIWKMLWCVMRIDKCQWYIYIYKLA